MNSKFASEERQNGLLKLLVRLIFRPAKAFQMSRESAKKVLILCVVLLIAGIVASAAAEAGCAKGAPKKPPQGIQEEMQETEAASIRVRVASGIIFGILGLVIAWFLKTAFFYLLSKVWESKVGFLTLFSSMGLVYLPFFLRNILQSSVMLSTGKWIQHQGLSALVASSDPASWSTVGYALLSKIDLWVLWSLLLLFVALRVSVGLSGKRAVLLTAVYWALVMAMVATSSAIFSSFGGLLSGPGV